MKTLLFPRWCRFAGFVLLPLSMVLFEAVDQYHFTFSFLDTKETGGFLTGNDNLTDEVSIAGIILSLFMIGFSKLKTEDEYTKHVRLRSLNLTVYLNYLLILFIIFSVYGIESVMILALNIIILPALYIVILNFNLYIRPRLSKKASV